MAKQTKIALWTIAAGLLLFLPYLVKERQASAAEGTLLITADDSLSYAVSMMVASDLPYAIKELDITPATIDYFVKGLCDAFPVDASPEAIAYAHGVVVGASAMDMLDKANDAIYQSDTTQKVDSRIFLEGLKAMARGNAAMSLEDAADYYYSSVFRLPSEEFIAKNRERRGVETLPGGVQVKIERYGSGDVAELGSKVGYIYKASFINGNLFESSRGEVAEAIVGGMLPGLAKVFTTLPVGTKCKVYLPWDLAYGANGSDKVPPYSALVYDIEFVKIVKK